MSSKGNFISDGFGHRVYPRVARSPAALQDQGSQLCPFLTEAMGEDRRCVKSPPSLGVCSISCASNRVRQDWLTCPYRALDKSLFSEVVDEFFGSEPDDDRLVIPAPSLAETAVRSQLSDCTQAGRDAVILLQDKLGGEISIPKTERSPEMAFDITLVQLARSSTGDLDVTSYGILEIQTMDFHGSYRAAVKNLQDALRLHKKKFPSALTQNPQWASERIEGPNIANVFKRTFYQMMLKFRVGNQANCQGCVLALPQSVWDSWQRHLGGPKLVESGEGRFDLSAPGVHQSKRPTAWIYVFDLDAEANMSPSPISINMKIATDADSLAYFALRVAPQIAVNQQGVDIVEQRIRSRLARFWPEIWQ